MEEEGLMVGEMEVERKEEAKEAEVEEHAAEEVVTARTRSPNRGMHAMKGLITGPSGTQVIILETKEAAAFKASLTQLMGIIHLGLQPTGAARQVKMPWLAKVLAKSLPMQARESANSPLGWRGGMAKRRTTYMPHPVWQ